jgi:AAA family ATP:ADP antiporter
MKNRILKQLIILFLVILCSSAFSVLGVSTKTLFVAKKIQNSRFSLLKNQPKLQSNFNMKVLDAVNADIKPIEIEKSESSFSTKFQTVLYSLFPIQRNELKKFFSLSFLMFFVVFIFAITRETKDTLIVTNCGAESITFLKVYGVIPFITLFMIFYNSYLLNSFSSEKLFYVILLPFLIFFSLFSFVLYPFRNFLHPDSLPFLSSFLSSTAGSSLPSGLIYPINLLRNWSFSLYYIISELWSSAGVPLLFWSLANEIVPIDQAKRIYPLLALLGNLGPVFAGILMNQVSNYLSKTISNDEIAFERSLQVLSGFIVVAGCFVAFLHHSLRSQLREERDLQKAQEEEVNRVAATAAASSNANAVPVVDNVKSFIKDKLSVFNKLSTTANDPKQQESGSSGSISVASPVDSADAHKDPSHKKVKMSLSDSFALLRSNSYLLNIAVLVLSYGLLIEFTEIVWKAAVKAALPNKVEYLSFMGRYSSMTGLLAFFMMFASSNVVKAFGWKTGALITPIMMGVVSFPFFLSLLASKGNLASAASRPALLASIYIGLASNVLSKATRYAVFDPTKEMAYIPLDELSRKRGKAAIDVLGSRLGKSGGAFIQQLIVLATGNIFNGIGVVMVLFYSIVAFWISKSILLISKIFILLFSFRFCFKVVKGV